MKQLVGSAQEFLGTDVVAVVDAVTAAAPVGGDAGHSGDDVDCDASGQMTVAAGGSGDGDAKEVCCDAAASTDDPLAFGRNELVEDHRDVSDSRELPGLRDHYTILCGSYGHLVARGERHDRRGRTAAGSVAYSGVH